MIIAFYIPEELAEDYREDRFQDSLHRLRILAQMYKKKGETHGLVAGQTISSFDVKLMQQLESSFCVSREIVKGNGGVPLVGPDFPEAEWQLKALKEEYK